MTATPERDALLAMAPKLGLDPWPGLKWVWYDTGSHEHMLLLEANEPVEDVAEQLAEAVLRCNPSRHKGHGRQHSEDQAKQAYRQAVDQLNSVDYEFEWYKLANAIRLYEMWGRRPMPSIVVQPDEHDMRVWNAIITHPITGQAFRAKAADWVARTMPTPRQAGALKGSVGQWLLPKQRRLRRKP